jgi:hypothetical protein
MGRAGGVNRSPNQLYPQHLETSECSGFYRVSLDQELARTAISLIDM